MVGTTTGAPVLRRAFVPAENGGGNGANLGQPLD